MPSSESEGEEFDVDDFEDYDIVVSGVLAPQWFQKFFHQI